MRKVSLHDCRAAAFHIGGPQSFDQVTFFPAAEHVEIVGRNSIEMSHQHGGNLPFRGYDQKIGAAVAYILHLYRQFAPFEIAEEKPDYLVLLPGRAVYIY
jgi:hypothetical protein